MIVPARATVTATLFRRAKTLFDLRHENTRVALVQAALLFTWHVENSDTITCNAYHWVGVATRIALGLGMHRDLSARAQNTLMPSGDKEVYRKLWYCSVLPLIGRYQTNRDFYARFIVLQQETLVALKYCRAEMPL